MKGEGQFCPIAVACEVFAERWTPHYAGVARPEGHVERPDAPRARLTATSGWR